jgi:GNAT superfamily N-acetyltransferase
MRKTPAQLDREIAAALIKTHEAPNGFTCAYGGVGEISVLYEEGGCYVDNVEVDPEHQRQGIGTRLWEAAANFCWKRKKLALRSGYIVSSDALSFWLRQFKKGRATRVKTDPELLDPDIDDFYNEYSYALRTPPPKDLS